MGLSCLIYIFEEAEMQISKKNSLPFKKVNHKNTAMEEHHTLVLHVVVKIWPIKMMQEVKLDRKQRSVGQISHIFVSYRFTWK